MADDLFALAGDLLTRMVASVTAQGGSLPSLQYVAPGGMVAYDDEQLTVNVTNLFAGRPSAGGGTAGIETLVSEHSAEFAITLIRLTPAMDDAGNPPTPKALTTNANKQMHDAQMLFRAMMDIRYAGQWVDFARPFVIVGVRPYGPEGGVVGTIGTLQIEVFE